MQIQKLLKDKHGEMYLRACFILLIISIVFVLVWNFCLTIILANGQRKSAIQTLDKYTQLNAIDIHDSIKMKVDDTASLDPTVYIGSLCLAQGLTDESGVYAAYNSSGNYRYAVSDVNMTFTEELTTKIQVSYILNIPFRFMGTTTWLEIPLTIYSRLDPKFYEVPEEEKASYTVRHWKENLSGVYELVDTWTLYDKVGEKVTPETATYPGYKSPDKKAIIVSTDRAKVIDYYYDLETYTVTVTAGEGIASVTGSGTYKYGETVTISAVVSDGYLWRSWTGNTQMLPDRFTQEITFTMGSADITVTATAKAEATTTE